MAKDKRAKNRRRTKYEDIDDTPKKKKGKKGNKKTSRKKEKKKGCLGVIISKLLLLIFICLIVFGTIFGVQVYRNGGGLKGVLCTLTMQRVDDINKLEPINVLLIGISQDIDSTLTDTIMVCRYNPQTGKAAMLSIPRNTFVGKDESQEKKKKKINSIYAKSPDKLYRTVEKMTGLHLDYYAVINNNAVIEVVDAIGGIDFDVPIDMDYDDPTQNLHIHLKKGVQRIDGEKAEQLLRFRHNNDGTSYPASYGDNDFGRMKTQRNFMIAAAKQTMQLKNLPHILDIKYYYEKNVQTNITEDVIKKYIPLVPEFSMDSIQSYQLPGESKKYNELWFFVYSQKQTTKLVNEMIESTDK